jgi:hypothetical protein
MPKGEGIGGNNPQLQRVQRQQQTPQRQQLPPQRQSVPHGQQPPVPPSRGRPRLWSADTAPRIEVDDLAAELRRRHPGADDGIITEFARFRDSLATVPQSASKVRGDPVTHFVLAGRVAGGRFTSASQNMEVLAAAFPPTTVEHARERRGIAYALAQEALLQEPAATHTVTEFSFPFLHALVACEPDVARRSYLTMMLLTGARASCLFFVVPAKQISFPSSSAVVVQWRKRKALKEKAQQAGVLYDFKWSETRSLSPEVVSFLQSENRELGTVIGSGVINFKEIAAYVNGWLRKCFALMNLSSHPFTIPPHCPTSSVFRDVMDVVVESLGLSDDEVKLLMDHSPSVGRAFYNKQIVDVSRQVKRNTNKKKLAVKSCAKKLKEVSKRKR